MNNVNQKKYAEVIVDISNSEVDKIFDYSFFDNQYKLGQRVVVPFGSRKIEGYIIGIKDKTDYDESKVKNIIGKIDEFEIFNSEQLNLMWYMQKRYNLKLIDIIRLFLPSELRTGKITPLVKTFLEVDHQNVNKILSLKPDSKVYIFATNLTVGKQYLQADLNKENAYAVTKLKQLGFLKEVQKQVLRSPDFTVENKKKLMLSQPQQNAVEKICKFENKTFLLFGVTGSGKTEVYLNVIDKCIESGKGAILLVPEISLTPQMLASMKARFGNNVAILHSGLSSGERFDEWTRLKTGQAKIAIGARSAIFAPIENLGVIVVDEEHDGSYISENNPRYNTLEIANFRSKFNNCPLVLGSATPSIEDYYKAQTGEYELLCMPDRINKSLPDMIIVDMLSELREGNSSIFSRKLLSELIKTVENNKQAMIFINRRGYTSFQMCRDCGYIAKCDDCDVSLVYHKENDNLKCHYCGKTYKALTHCPNCNSTAIKQGAIGTQKVVSELQKIFPNVKIFRMDNDTTSKKDGHKQILQAFAQTKPSILVGTQMIAKGHDFSDVVTVGIMDADQALFCSDYKSNERTYQLLTQVSGRAGRADNKGTAIIQTLCPRHYVFRYSCSYDYKGFYDKEINLRKTTNFPPWTKIIRLLFSSEDDKLLVETLHICFEKIKDLQKQFTDDFIFLNAMKSPVKRIMKKHRYQILIRIKTDNEDEILSKIYQIINQIKNKDLTVFAELNPQNLS